MRIVFIGALEFGWRCLEFLLKNKLGVVGVFSLSDTHKERSGFKDFSNLCSEHNTPLYNLDNPKSIKRADIEKLKPDIILVISWSWIIPNEIIRIPPNGAIGHHPTLLPQGRGNAPIPWTLIKGLTKTGVTFFYLAETVDSGKIAGQKEFEVTFEDNASTLYEKAIINSITLLKETLPKIEKHNLVPKEQDETKASIWPRRTPEDGHINWSKPTMEIYNLIRGVTHPYPGAFTSLNGEKVFVWESRIGQYAGTGKQGEIITVNKEGVEVKTRDSSIILKKMSSLKDDECDAYTFAQKKSIKKGFCFDG